jgi:hypothetical protein
MDAGGDIDAIALENALVVNDIFYIYANANAQCRRIRLIRPGLLGALDIDRPSYCVNGARKFHQDRIASNLRHAAAVPRHVRLHDLTSQLPPPPNCFDLIERHKARETRDICKRDRREPPLDRR